nr:hypothetical protein [Bradyrhizobium diazoefficiens]
MDITCIAAVTGQAIAFAKCVLQLLTRGLARLHGSKWWRGRTALAVLLLCNALVLSSTNNAEAQCTARDVMQNQLARKTVPFQPSQRLVTSANVVPVWRTIATGTYPDSLALRNALSAIGCGVGGLAAEILARPAFIVNAGKADIELLAVSAAELGVQGETAALRQIYAAAQQLGFALAPAEIGPQLRLQYLDQPIGEFLIIGMEPITTWTGDPVILTVANGGAGLILIGQEGHDDVRISTASRFIFVRSDRAQPASLSRRSF